MVVKVVVRMMEKIKVAGEVASRGTWVWVVPVSMMQMSSRTKWAPMPPMMMIFLPMTTVACSERGRISPPCSFSQAWSYHSPVSSRSGFELFSGTTRFHLSFSVIVTTL